MSQDQDRTIMQLTSESGAPARNQEQDVDGYFGLLATFAISVAASATVEVGSRVYDHYNVPLLEGIKAPQIPD